MNKIEIVFLSFGFKYGVPLDANYVFDIRFIPNPYYELNLRKMSGRDELVQKYVMSFDETKIMLEHCFALLDFIIPLALKNKRSLRIAVGCTGGRHRSVAFAEWFFERYKDNSAISLYHRDILRREDE